MPKYEQSVPLGNIDKETALAFCYQALWQLNWNILFAGDSTLLGSTQKNWKSYGQQILCTVDQEQLVISSEMVKGEVADITGRNKRNVTELIGAFESVKATADESAVERSKVAVSNLRQATIETAEQEKRDAIEVEQAMNLPGSNLYVTYTIIAVNVLVFILMAINGAGIIEPNGIVHIQWGSNYSPLTLSGDWWRLLTNVFIHFGIIHLAMNMYCLYTVGVYLEPMLGKLRYTTAYLCTGVLASVASLWWHKEAVNSAGASGAIFGVYGLFLALLTSNLIPQKVRQELLKSIVVFVGYNLLYGMKSGVDNSAHIGGLVSGFIIGYGYVYGIKQEKQQQRKIQWMAPVIVLLTLVTAFTYLQENKMSDANRMAVLNEVKAASYKDNDKFNDKLNEFDKIHKDVNDFLSDTTLSYEQLNKKITEIGFPEWEQAERFISATKKYDISTDSHAKAEKLLQYIALKKNELEVIKQICETKKEDELMPELNGIRERANAVFAELVKQ